MKIYQNLIFKFNLTAFHIDWTFLCIEWKFRKLHCTWKRDTQTNALGDVALWWNFQERISQSCLVNERFFILHEESVGNPNILSEFISEIDVFRIVWTFITQTFVTPKLSEVEINGKFLNRIHQFRENSDTKCLLLCLPNRCLTSH